MIEKIALRAEKEAAESAASHVKLSKTGDIPLF